MTKSKQFAIAYSFTIPILLGVLLLEVGALYRLNAHQNEIVQGVFALSECDALLSALHDSEVAARGFVASGSEFYRSEYDSANSRLSGSLENLDELSKNDPSMKSNLQELRKLVARRVDLMLYAMDSRKTPRPAGVNSPPDTQGAALSSEIARLVAGVRAEKQARSQLEQRSAARSASTMDALVKYGGVVTIWIVGVAALLLFYDDAGRSHVRIEQRLHTDILESLPLGVCLTTESGVILYANPAAESTFGYDAGELVARNVSLLHGLDESGAEPNLVEILAQLVPRELWSGELPIRTKEGDTVMIASWIASIRVGEKHCRLLVQSASNPRGSAQPGQLTAELRPAPEGVEGIVGPPPATSPHDPELTRPPDSVAIGVAHRAK